jgi:signal peptidase II
MEASMKQRIRHLLYFIILIIIDQASKYWARTTLKIKGPITVIPKVLKLLYHENTGAVWGILSGKTGFLIILTVVLVTILVYLYLKIPMNKRYTPIKIIWVFIMAGAIGNFIDRITLHYVVDFIYFELIDFPIFNFADSCLTVSCIVLLLTAIFYYKDNDFAFLDDLFPHKKKSEYDSSDDTVVSDTPGITKSSNASDGFGGKDSKNKKDKVNKKDKKDNKNNNDKVNEAGQTAEAAIAESAEQNYTEDLTGNDINSDKAEQKDSDKAD